MNETSAQLNAPLPTRRILSIDVFRGLTMILMIFVNDLSSVHGLPWWTYHAHAQQDAMTYVDMVFPFFLFIVGMSLPLAIHRRLEQNPSLPALFLHILTRAAGLLVLGLILANVEKCDPAKMHMGRYAWALMGLFGGILFWLAPSREFREKPLFKGLRALGLVLLVATFAVFRHTFPDGHTGWIDGSYPEILGLIAYTYFSVAILYVITRKWAWAPLIWTVALTALCAVLTFHHVRDLWPLYIWPIGSGAMASITMAGVATSNLFFITLREKSHAHQLLAGLGYAVAAAVAAWLLTPLGISKIRATPTWCLYSIAAGIVVFAGLLWLCDWKGKIRWAALILPVGGNALLTYLLPDIFYFVTPLVGFTYLDQHFTAGLPGIVRAVVFTLVMTCLGAYLAKKRLRLQL